MRFVYRGEASAYDPATGLVSNEAVDRVTTITWLAMTGGAGCASRSSADKLATSGDAEIVSRFVPVSNPIPRPVRPFEADYPAARWPDGPPADASERLTRDMEGRPLRAGAAVAGRREAGGAERAI
jgi:hypothetical protein